MTRGQWLKMHPIQELRMRRDDFYYMEDSKGVRCIFQYLAHDERGIAHAGALSTGATDAYEYLSCSFVLMLQSRDWRGRCATPEEARELWDARQSAADSQSTEGVQHGAPKAGAQVERHWFYSGVGKGHPLANGALQVTNGVCTRHPFDVEADRRKLVDPEFLLMYWQVISQEEYEIYRKHHR